MLFNSYEFLFLFLPLTLLVYFMVAPRSQNIAILWLVLASLFFYGWWNPVYLLLIVVSMLVNYGLGRAMSGVGSMMISKRSILIIGIVFNLSVLGYFKYAGFFLENLNAFTGMGVDLGEIILPLAISFFTFQQIAYLVDVYRGLANEYRLLHYALFVTFFPQLIAGPIVHHKEMLPQFMRDDALRPRLNNIVIGLTIFLIGLFKKTVLADGVAKYASPVFDSAAAGDPVTFFVAWGGALAYTMQLYFDFSGYSDMAIGAARMFGIRLPLNFHSPYKATSIIEFWRRWHMTLSRFLRDYLYIPLGGSRSSKVRRYINLLITMLLGGLWHGAGWTFIMWGALHGAYLMINHAWRRVGIGEYCRGVSATSYTVFAWSMTFLAVVVGWVFFRATSFDAAVNMLIGMSGMNGVAIPNGILVRLGELGDVVRSFGVVPSFGGGAELMLNYCWVIFLLIIALSMPNTQQLMSRHEPALRVYESHEGDELGLMTSIRRHLQWQPTVAWAGAVACLGVLAVLALTSVSEFLYFQF